MVNDEIHLFLMYSARLAVKFFLILLPEFAKSMQNRYKSERWHIWLRIIANTVQRKLLRYTYNSVRYGNQQPDRHAIQISGNGPRVGK